MATESAEPKSKLINRDPFAEVRLTPVLHNGKATDVTRVELANEEGGYTLLPGVSSVHSAGYVLIPNQQVFDMVGDVLTRTNRNFEPIPSFGDGHSKPIHWDCKRFSAKWFSKELAHEVDGSGVALGVEAVNSYDGSQPVGIRFFAMYCMCANQFYINNMLGNFIFRHIDSSAGLNLQANVQDSLVMLRQQAEHFMKTAGVFKQLRDKTVAGTGGLDGFLKFRQDLNVNCWQRSRDSDVLDELHGVGVTSKMGLKQNTAPIDSYWRVLNAYTAVTTHKIGGFPGSNMADQVTQFTLGHAGIQTVPPPTGWVGNGVPGRPNFGVAAR